MADEDEDEDVRVKKKIVKSALRATISTLDFTYSFGLRPNTIA